MRERNDYYSYVDSYVKFQVRMNSRLRVRLIIVLYAQRSDRRKFPVKDDVSKKRWI